MDIDYAAVLDAFVRSDALGLMTVLRNGNRWDRSNVVFRDGRLVRYDKRRQTPDMDYIDYGVALLRKRVLNRIPPGRPFDLAGLYSELVAERPGEGRRAEVDLLSQRSDRQSSFSGSCG